MGRIRSIKPEFPQSESIGRLSRDARLLFIQLWTLVDDEGRARGSSRMLASLLYPYDSDAAKLIDGWMKELEDEACIRRYSVEGQTYLEVINWLNHQKIDRPTASKLPPFDESSRVIAKAREETRRKGGDQGRDMDMEASPIVIALPAIGGESFPVTQKQFDAWAGLYLGIDVLQELRKMVGWLDARPAKRKTLKGTPAFVVSWLGRAQDDNRGVLLPMPATATPKPKTQYQLDAQEQINERRKAMREAGIQ